MYDYCGAPESVPETQICTMTSVNSEGLKKAYSEKCQGKSECQLDLVSFVDKSAEDSCTSRFSKIYIQYHCDFEDIVKKNQEVSLLTACIGILACFLYRFLIYFLRISSSLSMKKWDLKTVTAADWTVCIEIPDSIWKEW